MLKYSFPPVLYSVGFWVALAGAGGGFVPSPVLAQILVQSAPPIRDRPVSPGTIRPESLPPSRQTQPEITPEPPLAIPDLQLPPVSVPVEGVPGGVKVVRVEKFVIVKGSQIFSQDEIDKVTKPFLKRDLSFAELLQAADAITQLYVFSGYITTGAFIPANRGAIEKGIVPVEVREGYVDARDIRVQFVVPKPAKPVETATPQVGYQETDRHRLRSNYIRSRLALATQAPLNKKKLLEALQLLKLNPLIQDVQAELAEGTRPGQGVLIVKVVEAKRLSASVLLDNGRSPSVGSFRRQLQFNDLNVLGLGDRLFLAYTNTDGSNAGDMNYTVPINPRNGTINFSFGVTSSKIVEAPFDVLNIRSNSKYVELTYRQPLLQSPTQEFALGFTVSHQFSKATLVDGEIPFPVVGSDFEGNTRVTALRFFQEWTLQNSQYVFALRSQFSLGIGVGATENEKPPDGRFFAWRGQAQWVRLLALDTPLLLRGDMQFAARALVPLEQFGLGGFSSVRGYRQDAILSDSGVFGSAEVRVPVLRIPEIGGLLQVAPFAEVGTAWNQSGIKNPDPSTLASVGVGLRLQIGDRLTGRFDWGIPLISTNQPKNTLQEQGFYFSLIYRFL